MDTSIGTSNLGDYFIMENVRRELSFILDNNFVYELPTHVPAFNSLAVWKNSLAVQNYSSADYKFVGGSNLLVKNLLTHYPQWNINLLNYKPLCNSVLVGVGAGAGQKSNYYTKRIYTRLLSRHYYHSVRDERSKSYVESLGLKAINTGCVTMWGLTPDFCSTIPKTRGEDCIFTLTGGNGGPIKEDQELLNILVRNYKNVYYWLQGDYDLSYLKKFNNIDNIIIVPPKLEAYKKVLESNQSIDYIGTRLHGGICAIQHKKRSIIISIDERADEINKSNHLNCIYRIKVAEQLEKMINSEFATNIEMPFNNINRWKEQFV